MSKNLPCLMIREKYFDSKWESETFRLRGVISFFICNWNYSKADNASDLPLDSTWVMEWSNDPLQASTV